MYITYHTYNIGKLLLNNPIQLLGIDAELEFEPVTLWTPSTILKATETVRPKLTSPYGEAVFIFTKLFALQATHIFAIDYVLINTIEIGIRTRFS